MTGRIAYTTYAAPLGELLVAATPHGLAHVSGGAPIGSAEAALARLFPHMTPLVDPAPCAEGLEALDGYFTGRPLPLPPLDLLGTPFQLAVWRALAEVPFGERRTYGELAAALGRPGAARAVGAACARNPIGILIPCHRVVGGAGALTGYAGGLAAKRWLLAHEGA